MLLVAVLFPFASLSNLKSCLGIPASSSCFVRLRHPTREDGSSERTIQPDWVARHRTWRKRCHVESYVLEIEISIKIFHKHLSMCATLVLALHLLQRCYLQCPFHFYDTVNGIRPCPRLDRSEMTTLCATQHRRTQPGHLKKASWLPVPGTAWTTPNICKPAWARQEWASSWSKLEAYQKMISECWLELVLLHSPWYSLEVPVLEFSTARLGLHLRYYCKCDPKTEAPYGGQRGPFVHSWKSKSFCVYNW